MTLKISIKDGRGTSHLAGVSFAGELTVDGFGSVAGIQTKFNALNVANTAFNFYTPISKQVFNITSVLFDTPAAATTIDIYEASSSTSITIDKSILKISLSGKNFYPVMFPFGGFLQITEGEFLNAKTDNATVNMTIIGFYKPIP